MSLYSNTFKREYQTSIKNMREIKDSQHSEASIAIPIKILKDAGKSCSLCRYFTIVKFTSKCNKHKKNIAHYNICIHHEQVRNIK